MLANYRCNEIREGVFKEHYQAVINFTNESSGKLMDNFKSECKAIVDQIVGSYDKLAANYDEKVYLNIRNQILSTLSSKFYVCFSQQIGKMIPISQKFIRMELQKLLKSDEKFYDNAIKLKTKFMKDLLKKSEDIKVFDDWVVSDEQFSEVFDEIIDNQKKQCLDEKKTQITVKYFNLENSEERS
jgi:hypothetical protein